jgi:predicted Rossmann fold nucleotide-binding protein DprA/Smf involved in DNA uptake
VDDVIAEAGLSAGQVLAALTMLEIKGLITRLPGKRIMKK